LGIRLIPGSFAISGLRCQKKLMEYSAIRPENGAEETPCLGGPIASDCKRLQKKALAMRR